MPDSYRECLLRSFEARGGENFKGKEHPKFFFEIFKYVKVLNERNTVLFTESKKLVSNSRYKPTKLTLRNDSRIVENDVTAQ